VTAREILLDRKDEDPDPVALPVEDSIDLHAFRPRDVREVVGSYLDAAIEAGFDEVRVIHGRGIGVQRETVRSILSRHPAVLGFRDAPPERGGWGSTIVRLRRSRGERGNDASGGGTDEPR
jgi:dsDNA-specific endonuclease/ATPase MutS2